MKSIPPAVLTLWMPALLLLGMCLFLSDMSPVYWVVCIPLVSLLGFMNTLAEIHDVDARVQIKRWWGSIYVPKTEVVHMGSSILGGVGYLQIRRFVPPWGRVYFVADWSTHDKPNPKTASRYANASMDHRDIIPDAVASGPGITGGLAYQIARLMAEPSFLPAKTARSHPIERKPFARYTTRETH